MGLRLTSRLELDRSKLTEAGERATNLVPFWVRDVQPLVTDFLTRRFDSEGAYQGAKWTPHAPATTALRSQPGRGRGGIGRDLGTLWASLVKSAGSTAAPNGLLVLSPTEYVRGTTVRHAQWFAGGYLSKTKPRLGVGPDGRPKWYFVRRKEPVQIPARPIFPDPVPGPLVSAVETALTRYLTGGST